MKEQIQVPFDTNSSSEKEKEEGTVKNLGRPKIAASLQKPKIEQFKARLYRHCSCGRKTCRSPEAVRSDNPWVWVYKDKLTEEIVKDPILPRQGIEQGWDWR